MLIILLWSLGIAFQVGNIVCSLLQLTHPYATRRWRVAWGWACLAHGFIIALRIRQALVMGFSPVVSALPSPTWEQCMPLVVSGGLFLFNWHIVTIFFSQRSRLVHHAAQPPAADAL